MCGIKSLSFAVGAYLPLSTTLPIFIGGAIRGIVEAKKPKKVSASAVAEEDDLGKGNLFATGLVAGGAVAGVIVAFLTANDNVSEVLAKWSAEHSLTNALGENGYYLLGVIFFAIMGGVLYWIANKKNDTENILVESEAV